MTAGNWPADPAQLYARTTKFAGQLASLGTTVLLAAPPPDMYHVDVYQECGLGGAAGTVLCTVSYTDNVGATTQATVTLALTGLGHLATRFVIVVASGDITFTTTVVGAVGSPQYNVTARAQRAPSTV